MDYQKCRIGICALCVTTATKKKILPETKMNDIEGSVF